MFLKQIIFPLAISLNMFSMTALLIISGLFSKLEIAADLGIVQAATLVVFMAFATNARNIIISKSSEISLQQLLSFRLWLLLPLAFIAYQISINVVDLTHQIVLILILRKCIEWIVEMQISKNELEKNYKFAFIYSAIQIFTFCLMLFPLYTGNFDYFIYFLFIWGCSPAAQIFPFLTVVFKSPANNKKNWRLFLPHIGSSWIIACSTYIFRILIVLLAGKTIGGLMFAAYAIGGMVNSVYTYALGPSIAANITNKKKESFYTKVSAFSLYIVGGIILLISTFVKADVTHEFYLYLSATGCSLIGGGIMLLAQRKRIHILQLDKNNVFVPDVMINIILISSIPLAFFIFGEESLVVLFLWSSLLTYLIYLLPNVNNQWAKSKKSGDMKKTISKYISRENIQVIILLFLVLPVFFQFSGNFIFDETEIFYNSGGKLSQLPLPIALVSCFAGIFLLARYKNCYISSVMLFSFFSLMFLSTLLRSGSGGIELAKILILIQFILPVFGLMLGQSYIAPENYKFKFESLFLYVLFIMIPLESIATHEQATGILTPYVYLFSVYQHLQYVPVIFVGLYFIAFLSLYQYIIMRVMLILLMPFLCYYVIYSFSSLAILMLVAIVLYGCFVFFLKQNIKYVALISLLFVGVFSFVIHSMHDVTLEIWGQKYMPVYKVVKLIDNKYDNLIGTEDPASEEYSIMDYLPVNIKDRINIWSVHWEGVSESPKSFLFGSASIVERKIAASAHNYYLDLIYNFGFISLLPILALIVFTIIKVYQNRRFISMSPSTFGLLATLAFLLLVDNFFKVGLKQPYPGIMTFFLWGVLLSRLTTSEKELDK